MSKQSFNSELYSLVTIPEAAKLFCRGQGTIRYHIDRGNLEWRKTEGLKGIYLISLQSLIDLYGNPPKIAAS
jgi:hypothetical protein